MPLPKARLDEIHILHGELNYRNVMEAIGHAWYGSDKPDQVYAEHNTLVDFMEWFCKRRREHPSPTESFLKAFLVDQELRPGMIVFFNSAYPDDVKTHSILCTGPREGEAKKNVQSEGASC